MKISVYGALRSQNATNQTKVHSQSSPQQVPRWCKLENSVETSNSIQILFNPSRGLDKSSA